MTPARSIIKLVDYVGAAWFELNEFIGSLVWLFVDAFTWIYRSLVLRQVRIGRSALVTQILRVGVRSIAIVSISSTYSQPP